MRSLSVVVNNLNVRWPRRPIGPFETYPPLVIDTNTELALSVSRESLKTVPGKRREIADGGGCLKPIQLQSPHAFKPREGFHLLAVGEFAAPLIPVVDDHPPA